MDSNLNALLLYSIVEPEARRYFEIDANTGALRTRSTPDREIKDKFEFSVQVQDQGE
jgi:protocadherin Fat 1/2/3